MRDLTIQRYLDDLAAGSAEPGGGSATALAVAMGAALVSMVCRLTIGREGNREREELLAAAIGGAEELQAQALRLAEEDTAAYGAVTRARTLPRDTEQLRELRTQQIQEALRGATEVPLRTVAAAAQVIGLSAGIQERVIKSALSDLRVGSLLAKAALEGAALNVTTNLALIHDEKFKAAASADLERHLSAKPDVSALQTMQP